MESFPRCVHPQHCVGEEIGPMLRLRPELLPQHFRRDLLDRAREIEIARGKIAGKSLIPLEKLQGSLSEIRSEEEVALAYAQALSLCGFIDRNFGERVLFDMVSASKTSEGWRAAYRRRTGLEIDGALAEIAR